MSVRPKKALGQHFLNSPGTARKIAQALTLQSDPEVLLEIGPGTGALTKHLIELYPQIDLRVMEIDLESVAFLEEQKVLPAGSIYPVNFLKADLTALLGDSFAVIGNFPYNISTQILFRVFDYREHVTEVVGMFQKEVAERVAEPPGSKKYGILSVLLQVFFDIEYLFTVPPGAFHPPPKVDSGVIRMQRNDVVDPGCDTRLLVRVVKAGFNQRRKMLRGSLKSILPKGTEIPEVYATKRPEQLSKEEFIDLTAQLTPYLQ